MVTFYDLFAISEIFWARESGDSERGGGGGVWIRVMRAKTIYMGIVSLQVARIH